MTEKQLTNKIKKLWADFELVIKPLEKELKLKGVTEHINKYYYIHEEGWRGEKYVHVKSYLFTTQGTLKYKCIVVSKENISEEIMSEYDFEEECSKQEFDDKFTKTLENILK